MKKLTQIDYKLPVNFLREGKYYIAYSPALDLSTSGKSFDEVKKRFEEVVQIFFEELLDKGTFEEELFNLGWRKVKGEFKPPVVIANEEVSIPVRINYEK